MPSANNHTPQQPSASTGMPVDDSNVEMEQGILGLILADDDHARGKSITLSLFREQGVNLEPACYYRGAHHIIAETVNDLDARGCLFDFATVGDELQRRGKLDEVGGMAYLWELASRACGDEWHALDNAKRLHSMWYKRKDGELRHQIATATLNGDDALAEKLRKKLDAHHAGNAATAADIFPVLSDVEAADIPPAQGIIGDVLYEDTLAFLYGKSGMWKSFVAVSWACAIATGRDWLGRSTVAGEVVYIAAEGARGIGQRIEAWKQHHGISRSIPVHIIPLAVQLLDADQVQRLERTIRAVCRDRPVMVVIDTMARSTLGGNENDTPTANTIVAATDVIKRAFGCCVLVVHHPGKDEARGMRGNSALYAAADTVVNVAVPENTKRLEVGDIVRLVNDKPKESEPFKDIFITTERLCWTREDGATSSSLVVQAADACATEQVAAARLTPSQRIALDALARVLALYPEGATHGQWKDASGVAKTTFTYAVRDLLALGKVTQVTQDMKALYRLADDPAEGKGKGKVGVITPFTPPTTQAGSNGSGQVNFGSTDPRSGWVRSGQSPLKGVDPDLDPTLMTQNTGHVDPTYAPQHDVEQTHGAPERVMVPPSPGKPTPTSNGSVVVTVSDCRVARPADIPGRADTIAYLARELQEDDPTLTDADAFQRAQDEWTRYHE